MQRIRAFPLREPTESPRGPVRHFSELIAYRKSFVVAAHVFELSRAWPAPERYSLTDQVRRSSRSIGANISEAWAKRRYPAHWISKLTDSDGETNETEHWLACALQHGYISDADFAAMQSELAQIGKLLGALISKPHLFCGRPPAGCDPVTRRNLPEVGPNP
ncbi:MAG TPA: four helix bundle protein [Opitutaceae bacterium]|nr:four helix bundle protein [Opitutaceae bacterium]